MKEGNKVQLHGMWASTYSKRVELALRVKGIPYEYIEEDLSNKSQLLLKYNPVHKKVPVLVHDGKPISESSIIIEYIDETWNTTGPRILPEDPYERAKVRFWASFIQDQLFEGMIRVVTSEAEAQEKALEDVFERLKVFEEGMKEYLQGGDDSFTNGETLGVLDILMVATFGPYEAHEQVLGFKMLDPERNPLLFSWVAAVKKHPVVKESEPPHDKLVKLLQSFKPKSRA